MQTLEALGRRIATTNDLKSIVRTMKALSAVSIHQFDQAARSIEIFSAVVELGLEVGLRQAEVHAPASPRRDGAPIAIVVGSDHGLCGRFNEQIAKRAATVPEAHPGATASGRPRWLAVGHRLASRMEADGLAPAATLELPASVEGLTRVADTILTIVDAWRSEGAAGGVAVVHNERRGGTTAVPSQTQLLPLSASWEADLRSRSWTGPSLPMTTMASSALLAGLIREHLFGAVFRALAASLASEHATRLAAMQAAERNIEEHLATMNADYRRRRQEAITEELLDVVAGFEALAPARQSA